MHNVIYTTAILHKIEHAAVLEFDQEVYCHVFCLCMCFKMEGYLYGMNRVSYSS